MEFYGTGSSISIQYSFHVSSFSIITNTEMLFFIIFHNNSAKFSNENTSTFVELTSKYSMSKNICSSLSKHFFSVFLSSFKPNSLNEPKKKMECINVVIGQYK